MEIVIIIIGLSIVMILTVIFVAKLTSDKEIPYHELNGIDLYPMLKKSLDSEETCVTKPSTLPKGVYTLQEYRELTNHR